ncbi:NAD-dependent epimerase/dehydratase family protein [Thomasclavelia spiroformis]|uniref:NAD-dependent epimerase/dehydratase family protein n=1 Tax=Thomasclavelia spiroformis TaxID=29348 RepID=UPI00241CB0E8|nr:NAD-dependent epimerase/dehydratase family protein [Thomasclavelia spiroformis]MBS6115835.1 NAD-dependent epimerase/dehydratase family protein [Thomasclavelia spiroformis]
MKKILITGANSYIGTSFEKYIYENYPDGYQIDTLDMMDSNWKEYDFSGYDSIFHVAGIAHVDVGNVPKETERLYYQVNCDLAYETALKAKKSEVKQFIYMSSIIVYGESAPYGKTKIITKDTKPKPANFYGDSKLQAEIKLSPLQDDSFNLVIIRPPMIYGKGSKGNYPMLSKLAKKLPVFPKINNQRSMLYVENLCEFVRLVISKNDQGIYYPQNSEYASTTAIVKTVNPEIRISGILNPGVFISSKVPGKISGLCNKAFGNLVYEKSMSQYSENYCRYDLKESIWRTEGLQ